MKSGPGPQKNPRARTPRAAEPARPLADFWQEQIRVLGRRLVYVETGFVLAILAPSEQAQARGLLKELLSDRLVTSTYVITEAVRRIIKSRPHEFVGPSGERNIDLALYFLFEWIRDNNVVVISPPECVFNEAQRVLRDRCAIGCDLTDVLSFVIVRGLEQNRILAKDSHFRALGLTTLLQTP
jgi:predicted nucleic acid-binding protein